MFGGSRHLSLPNNFLGLNFSVAAQNTLCRQGNFRIIDYVHCLCSDYIMNESENQHTHHTFYFFSRSSVNMAVFRAHYITSERAKITALSQNDDVRFYLQGNGNQSTQL